MVNYNRFKFILPFLTMVTLSFGQSYLPSWESLDQRPVADWFSDAKFGIFIHWGPYSVPAWSPKGTYSEWYQFWMQNKTLFGNGEFTGTEVYDYHNNTFGKDFTYYDFAKEFKAELFDANEWANIFSSSGAKYIVITSKHHDGFTLWPNKEANDRGFAWNAGDVGPQKDLLGELSSAVKGKGIKMGFYYSLYEWFHPWWIGDKERFVDEHFHPQFKDLVERYQPDILWGDGEWELSSKDWKTPELMVWLFNESSVAESVVINDRWGSGVRHNHGGYYTTEYESGLELNHPWEECRGMGFSFGYNRQEDAEDYNSSQVLILMLVDIVSKGGNLLLDIGPDGHGKIPAIMQERLLEMGKWLEKNGEAIYGTSTWKTPVQWTNGRQDFKADQHYLGGDYILKLTTNPDRGFARKEVFYTYNKGNLYAILPSWPDSRLVLKNVKVSSFSKVTLLENGAELNWIQEGENLSIRPPEYDPATIKNTQAYVLKISGVDPFTRNPTIIVKDEGFQKPASVTLKGYDEDVKLFYTTDGSDPDEYASLYRRPFWIQEPSEIKVRGYISQGTPSDIISENVKVYDKYSDIILEYEPDEKYTGKGPLTLADEKIGTSSADGEWLGFLGSDLDATIDLGDIQKIEEIRFSFLHNPNSWIFGPIDLQLELSEDGVNYKSAGRIQPLPDFEKLTGRIEYKTPVFNNNARYIRVFLNNIGVCPEGHDGAGQKSWLFVDEINIDSKKLK